jgi:predicted metal-dependent RNase
MKLIAAGGCGEHGRNCFLVENEQISILVDCGIIPGAKNPYPRLSEISNITTR